MQRGVQEISPGFLALAQYDPAAFPPQRTHHLICIKSLGMLAKNNVPSNVFAEIFALQQIRLGS
jgi:hypothetical protein